MLAPFWIALCLLTLIGRPVAAERTAGDEEAAPDPTEAGERAAPATAETDHRAVSDTTATARSSDRPRAP